MASSQPSTPKHLRCGTNVNNVETNCNTSNMKNINLLSLPNEALNHILSYSIPRKECQIWEWIGVISQTSSLRRLAKSYAPTRIVLEDFKSYTRLNSDERFDARIRFLQSLRDCSWKRQSLKELQVNQESVIRWRVKARGIKKCCNDIKDLLQTLLTTPSSFPELEWLDIELQSDDIPDDYGLVDSESLPRIPYALPALQKLCLCKCFKDGEEEFDNNTPRRLMQFFSSLHTPLTSLSICGPMWITDAHIETIMPYVGTPNLVCLELIGCVAYGDEYEDGEGRLTDASMYEIAKYCNSLESFSMVDSEITSHGLRWVLNNNPNITTLNLSASTRLWSPDNSAFDIISKYLPRLEKLRNYWPDTGDWLNDDGLISLVNAQEKESGGSGIFLKLIGLSNCDKFMPQLTIRGMKYAIEKGVKEIEIDEFKYEDEVTLLGSIVDLDSDVKLYQPHYVHYIDGSIYERKVVEY